MNRFLLWLESIEPTLQLIAGIMVVGLIMMVW
jgi:hypothetical protein